MTDEFQPVSDEQSVPTPEVPETGFVDGDEPDIQPPMSEQSSATIFDEDSLDVVEVPTLQLKAVPLLWGKLRRLIGEDPESLSRRMADLDRAIESSPDAATNYVLRGELYLQSREYELALADFEHGLELADAQFESSSWGIIAQTVRDRALADWQKAARKLRKRSAT